MEIFQASHIVKKYGNYTALNDVSIAVPQGTIYGLLGPNGAGKTTLIRIINQIFAPDQGELIFKGRKMTSADIISIGYLPEERGLYKKMKIGEQALYLAQLKGMSKNDALKRIKYWFEKFEIQSWWNKKVEDLSKGMAQKLQFIVTVLHEPELLIFDEPFSGFDPINTSLLRDEILELKQKGATIIFSTHNMASVEELCDNISLINNSEVILEGGVHEVKERFKANEFEISFHGNTANLPDSISSSFNVVGNKIVNELNYLNVKLPREKTGNDLLKEFLPHVQINSFREVYPSMNDIFIDVVETANKKNQL
jgi:ABC-2 type transport system ATP-binding protein